MSSASEEVYVRIRPSVQSSYSQLGSLAPSQDWPRKGVAGTLFQLSFWNAWTFERVFHHARSGLERACMNMPYLHHPNHLKIVGGIPTKHPSRRVLDWIQVDLGVLGPISHAIPIIYVYVAENLEVFHASSISRFGSLVWQSRVLDLLQEQSW